MDVLKQYKKTIKQKQRRYNKSVSNYMLRTKVFLQHLLQPFVRRHAGRTPSNIFQLLTGLMKQNQSLQPKGHVIPIGGKCGALGGPGVAEEDHTHSTKVTP